MNEKERKSCIFTIKTLMNLAYNIHGVMDVVDVDNCKKIIEMLDSGYLAGRWIPVSERLPEIDKEVLVTDGELCWVCSLFESQDIEDGLYQWEDNYGHWHDFETWVAWMPLPEPARLDRAEGLCIIT